MRDSDGMELFESYLRDVKRSSQNTISSYLRDIRQLSEYLHAHTDADLGSAEEEELCEYIDWMRSNGKSVATVSRAIASLKNFYGFLLNNHYVQHNPTGKLVPDKAKQKLPQILSSKEVELLLAQMLHIDGFQPAFAVDDRRFGEFLTLAELFHHAGFLKFSLQFLQSTFDVVTFFDRNYDHCKYLFLS